MPTPQIHRNQAWRYEWRIRVPDQYTPGDNNPLEPDVAVSSWLSATPSGSPLTPGCVLELSRGVPGPRVDGREFWSATLGHAEVAAALAGQVTGATIYEVTSIDGNLFNAQREVAD